MIEEAEKVLISNPNGWEMVYTTPVKENNKFAIKQSFLIQMLFGKDKTVTTWTDYADTPTESSYRFSLNNGPVLSFDTYGNLHILADPAITSKVDAKKSHGHYGEFEFEILSVSTDKILLRGVKYGETIELLPLSRPAGISNEGFSKTARKFVNEIASLGAMVSLRYDDVVKAKVEFEIPELPRFVTPSEGVAIPVKFTFPSATGGGEPVIVESTATPVEGGFKLNPPIEYEGKKHDTFIYNKENNRYESSVDANLFIRMDISALTAKLFSGSLVNGFFISDMSPKLKEVITPESMTKFFPGEYRTIQWYNFVGKIQSISVLMKSPDGKSEWHDLNVKLEVVDDDKALYRMVVYQEGLVSSQEVINALLDDNFAGFRAFAICFSNVLFTDSQFYIEEMVPDQVLRFTWASQNGEYWVEFQKFK